MVALAKTQLKRAYTPPHLLRIDAVLHGDSLEVLRGMPDNSVHAIVSDPPAGIGFMQSSKDGWDSDKGGRSQWVAWLSSVMGEALRCLKPGGHALIWALPRTSHWTALALEDAGFLVKDTIFHHFGSGFPKSMDISKAIDKMQGAEREVVGQRIYPDGTKGHWSPSDKYAQDDWSRAKRATLDTAPATPEAQQWQGYGTALKPSTEIWWLVQKPISERTIAANVLRWGTGGLNIDDCRVGIAEDDNKSWRNGEYTTNGAYFGNETGSAYRKDKPQGRFPANLLLSHSLFCVPLGEKRVPVGGGKPLGASMKPSTVYGIWKTHSTTAYGDSEGMETVENWLCDPSCPVYQLDLQSGIRKSGIVYAGTKRANESGFISKGMESSFAHDTYGDQGGASRYFQQFSPDADDFVPFYYCSKASRRERSNGLGKMVTLRANLTEEQKAWVVAELEKAGVRTHE